MTECDERPLGSTSVRTEYIFTVSPRRLAIIEAQLALCFDLGVNITGLTVTPRGRCREIRFVVGQPDVDDATNAEAEEIIRQILCDNGVDFRTLPAIQLLNIEIAPAAGSLFTFYNALWCNVDIGAQYIGEPVPAIGDFCPGFISFYFEILDGQVQRARELISDPNNNQCLDPDTLCVDCDPCHKKDHGCGCNDHKKDHGCGCNGHKEKDHGCNGHKNGGHKNNNSGSQRSYSAPKAQNNRGGRKAAGKKF